MKIALDLSDDTAMAVAQLCKRFTYDDAERLANRHDGGRERDLMITGLDALGPVDIHRSASKAAARWIAAAKLVSVLS